MALEKAVILNLDTDEEIQVLFNPGEYVIEKTTPWKEHNINGLDSPAVEFTIGERKRLSMELYFDTSEDKTDVRAYTDRIEELMLVNSDQHRPPLLMFSWGNLKFRCVLEDLVQRFTLFMSDGTPVRALLKVLFKEYSTAAGQIKEKPRHSSDHSKQIVLQEGDSLCALAGREYQDPAKWRFIAEANGIEDPLSVREGTLLSIPPLY